MTDNEYVEIDRKLSAYHAGFKPDVEQGLERLHSRIEREAKGGNRLIRLSPRLMAMAAGFLLLLLAGGWYLTKVAGSTVITAEERAVEVQLPDGTEVLLKPGSQLKYRQNYGQETRSVELIGEGFFEVVPDANRPFLAQQGAVGLRVVGTSFNLRAIPETEFFEVEVSSGKVMLVTDKEELPVSALECGEMKPGGTLAKRAAPYLNNHAWRTGKMSFKESLFSQALSVVERTYRISIQYAAGNVEDCDFPVTATFNDDPLADVFAHFEQLSGGRFVEVSATEYRLSGWCDGQ